MYPSEDFVLLLFQDEDDVTRLNPWLRIPRFPSENNLGGVLVSLLNMYLKNLLLRQQSLQKGWSELNRYVEGLSMF